LNTFAPFFAFVGATICLCGGVVGASDAKTTLMREAVVNGKSIYLSDLLPDSSPVDIRVSAQEMLVGKSPQPGSIRVLSSGEIVRLLKSGNLLRQVNVPEQIVVHRLGHLVTREEVAEAIRKTLSRNQDVSNAQIASEEIGLSARVTTLAENPALRVTRIEWDRSLREMKFWLVSGAEPTLLPFIATTQSKLQSGFEIQPWVNAVGSLPNLNSNRPVAPAPALVEAGKIARLHLVSGAEIQMYLTAIPFERGVLGQTVRIKIQQTGKILNAYVTGPNQLEADF
jgi:hypothetical protein